MCIRDRLRYEPDGHTLDAQRINLAVIELFRFDASTGRRSGAPVTIGVADRSPPDFNQVVHVAVSADGRRLVTPEAYSVIVRDARSLEVLRRVPARTGRADSCASGTGSTAPPSSPAATSSSQPTRTDS